MGTRAALAFTAAAPRSTVGCSPCRAELLAGLAFLEGSSNPAWGVAGLRAWFAEHLTASGWMMTPVVVTEPGAGSVALHGSSAHGLASHGNLPQILSAARDRVLAALRGLTASSSDDRFLSGAIYAGRVRRMRVDGASRWVVRPAPTATLSDIVLAVFAADVLTNREGYETSLCVCDTCSRVTFKEGVEDRRSCPAHRPALSGFIRKVAPEQDMRWAS